MGSSPLTRGKLRRCRPLHEGLRHIPAHTGKTSPAKCSTPSTRAHPRSRRENGCVTCNRCPKLGSSPNTRGKQAASRGCCVAARLIPTHARKTCTRNTRTARTRAHPHSRGENLVQFAEQAVNAGSSPLTRGKLEVRLLGGGGLWLIPAHAGKNFTS